MKLDIKRVIKADGAWIASVPQYTYFLLNKSRGKKIAKELIGDHQGRMIVTDRYSAYNYLPSENHQFCWAHLKRDFQKIAERSDKRTSRTCENILELQKRIFTVVTSCKQGRDVLTFIIEAIQEYFLGEKNPSLVFQSISS